MKLFNKINYKRSAERRNKLQKIWHYFTAFIIALDAHGTLLFVILCLFTSGAIVIMTIFYKSIIKRAPRMESLIYFLEGVVCLFIGYFHFLEGKIYLPYAWFLASFLCALATIISFFRNIHSKVMKI
jgi:hypothetical protein